MNQVSRKIVFNFRREDGKEIPQNNLDILDKKAINHICKLVADGYIEGELIDNIGDVEYKGFWLITND